MKAGLNVCMDCGMCPLGYKMEKCPRCGGRVMFIESNAASKETFEEIVERVIKRLKPVLDELAKH